MSTRNRNLVIAGGGLVLLLILFSRMQSPADQRSTGTSPVAVTSPNAAGPVGPVPASVSPSALPVPANLHTHAVDVSWLNGFPPDAAPGDAFDIWVAWDRSVVKGPNIQLLLEDVVVEKIAPPVTPEGPYVAYLIVTRAEARDLLYGTKYGALSVTQPAGVEQAS